MNEFEWRPFMNEILRLLGKTELPEGDMFPRKIPNSNVWFVSVKKSWFMNDASEKDLDSYVRQNKWSKKESKKEDYWDIQ
jgi:hypothetical protein